MTRLLSIAAFIAGLASIGWIGAGTLAAHPLALGVTLLVGAFYIAGGLELRRFHQATAGLAQALDELSAAPAGLESWLERLHPSLRNAVRQRIDGERVALPGPALTPYLSGLLVLLGMLGTLLGMVVTLNGTGSALDSAADLQSIRHALSAPVKGLGLAFGTSVAGVMASAMLGLVSALCRRERTLAAQRLDAKIATTLRGFSQGRQREQSLELLQRQADAMPALVDRLQAMMATIERQHQALNDRLVSGQERFHGSAETAYAALAASVDRSLKNSLAESARVAGAAIQPAVEATMAGIARETAALHDTLAQAAQQQSAALLRTVHQGNVDLQAAIAAQDEQRLAAWTETLQAMAASLQQRWQQAGADAVDQQQRICRTLEQTAHEMTAQAQSHAKDTIAEIGQLMQAAAEAPRVAAEVVAELRRQVSDSLARDNAMLDERNRLLQTLGALLDAVNHASTDQRAAIDALVATSAELQERTNARFAQQVDAQAEKMSAAAAQITGSAAEVASLGEAFGHAVGLFGESNDKLVAQLQRIEATLGKQITRSDEQLAYYVAQAREVIDLSIVSQQQIVEDLQRLARPLTSSSAQAPQAAQTADNEA